MSATPSRLRSVYKRSFYFSIAQREKFRARATPPWFQWRSPSDSESSGSDSFWYSRFWRMKQDDLNICSLNPEHVLRRLWLMKISLNGVFVSHTEIYLVLAFREICLFRRTKPVLWHRAKTKKSIAQLPVIAEKRKNLSQRKQKGKIDRHTLLLDGCLSCNPRPQSHCAVNDGCCFQLFRWIKGDDSSRLYDGK